MCQEDFNCYQQYHAYGYVEITIKAEKIKEIGWQYGRVYHHSGYKCSTLFLPHFDGRHIGVLYLPLVGENSFQDLNTKEKFKEFVAANFEDLANGVSEIFEKDFPKFRIGKVADFRCAPWSIGNICLIGDAAHTMGY